MESGVGIIMASRDAQNRPFVGRAVGCRVSLASGQVRIFFSRRKYPSLLDAIRRTGAIAASFSEPTSHKSLQIKAMGAELAAVEDGDADVIARHLTLFTAELERIHLNGALPRTILACPPEDLAAVTFVPAVAFTQTPGPVAGNRIEA